MIKERYKMKMSYIKIAIGAVLGAMIAGCSFVKQEKVALSKDGTALAEIVV